MSLHPSTFSYLKPTLAQTDAMTEMRHYTAVYADHIDLYVPEGADKTYILRKVREIGMWVNVAITREADGAPRE